MTAETMRTKQASGEQQLDVNELGTLRAVFSVFDVADRDGDIVRASAFTNGQQVPLVWAHDHSRPIGKGKVVLENSRAVFVGRFNLNTTNGKDAYESVKDMGSLQQYSWGFRILATKPNANIKGYDITKAEVFEVSPVLVGANQYTQTLDVKSAATAAVLDPEQRTRLLQMLLACGEMEARLRWPSRAPSAAIL